MKNKIEEGAAWTKKAGKNPKGGLNAKGRKSYEKENPGSDLKAPQPQGGARKKSFCARMSGMRKRQKDSNNTGKDRLSLSLKKWNCSTEIVRDARIALAEACWKGYTAYGMKMKNGKQVPNCVPTKTSKKKKAIKEAIFSLYEVRENRFRDAGRKTGEFLTQGKTGKFLNKVKGAASPLVKAGRRAGEVIDKVSYPLVNPYKAGKKAGEVLSPLIRAGRQVKDNAKAAGRMVSREGGYLKGALSQVKDNAKAGGRMVRKAVNKIPGMGKSPAAAIPATTAAPKPAAPKPAAPKPAAPKPAAAGSRTQADQEASDTIKRLSSKLGVQQAAAAKPAPAAAKPAPAAANPAPAPAAANPAPAPAAATPAAARPAATAYGTSRRAVNRARNKAAEPKTPDLEQPNLSVMDNIRRAVRDPSKNKEIDNWNAGKSEDKPQGAVQRETPEAATGSTRYQGRADKNAPRSRRATDDQPERTGGGATTTTLAGGGNTTRARDANRRRRDNSTEIVKKGRMALAEKVLEALSPDETKADPKTREKRMKKGAEAVKNRADKVIAKEKPESKKKAKHTKRDSQGRAGGLHDKEGVPVNTSSNHPDYLKKKLHKRATKDGGYGKEGKPTAADTEVNKQGVRGHEAKIAKKKEKSERQAKAQRISNKIRSMRGLVPLMPGEKHSSDDKLGDTEN
jgi:hypothetical protein